MIMIMTWQWEWHGNGGEISRGYVDGDGNDRICMRFRDMSARPNPGKELELKGSAGRRRSGKARSSEYSNTPTYQLMPWKGDHHLVRQVRGLKHSLLN